MERPETVYSSDPEGQPRLLLVDAGAVPEVFVRVVEAKRYLQSGEAETAAEAARMAGISRSAFYKYKEAVFPYDEERAGHILTVHLLLRDRPGILSAVLTAFAEAGANILTDVSPLSSGRRAVILPMQPTRHMLQHFPMGCGSGFLCHAEKGGVPCPRPLPFLIPAG